MGYIPNSDCFVVNDGNNSTNGILAMLPALLQKQGVDPSLIALCSNRSAFGSNGLSDIIALVVILAIFGNNGWGGGLFGNRGGGGCMLPNMINNDNNTQLLTQMIQRTGVDIQSLANMTNTSADAITAAINAVSKEICALSANQGQSFNQTLTAIMQGGNALQTQLAQCCCTLRDAITQQGYQSQLGQKDIQNSMLNGFNQVNVGMERGFNQNQVSTERGFSQLGYSLAEQSCATRQNTTDNTGRILAKLDAIEDSRKDREIASLTAQLTAANSRAERQAELAPIYKSLADIQCKQPTTITTAYSPFVAVPNCVAWQAGLYGGYPFNYNGGQFG